MPLCATGKEGGRGAGWRVFVVYILYVDHCVFGNVVIEKLINQMYGDGYQTRPPTQICQGWKATGKCGMSEGASLTSRGSLWFHQKEGSLSSSVAAPQPPLLQGAKAWGPSCSSDRHLVRPLCPAVL